MAFDTGSSDLFIPSTACGESCNGHKLYNPSASSTSKDLEKEFALTYRDGSEVNGEQYTDVVAIAGLVVRATVFFRLFSYRAFTCLVIGEDPDAWCCSG